MKQWTLPKNQFPRAGNQQQLEQEVAAVEVTQAMEESGNPNVPEE